SRVRPRPARRDRRDPERSVDDQPPTPAHTDDAANLRGYCVLGLVHAFMHGLHPASLSRSIFASPCARGPGVDHLMAKVSAPYIGKAGKVDLDEAIFGEPFHMSLVHETVRAELAARRRGTASTRTRAEVAMTGAKAFRQKGTGRARAGALSTPQRTGGGRSEERRVGKEWRWRGGAER